MFALAALLMGPARFAMAGAVADPEPPRSDWPLRILFLAGIGLVVLSVTSCNV